MTSSKKLVFISHINEESELAIILSDHIKSAYLGMLDTFVSSDGTSIPAGTKWFDAISEALSNSAVQISLCSPTSIKRPWINFEAGCSWIRNIPVIPLCHSGLQKGQLPVPISLLQAGDMDNEADLKTAFTTLSTTLGCSQPTVDYASITTKIKAFSRKYTYTTSMCNAVYEIVALENGLKQLFLAGSIQSQAVTVADYILMQLAPRLDVLKNDGLLSYYFNQSILNRQGSFRGGNITLSQKYFTDILPSLK